MVSLLASLNMRTWRNTYSIGHHLLAQRIGYLACDSGRCSRIGPSFTLPGAIALTVIFFGSTSNKRHSDAIGWGEKLFTAG